MLSPKRSLSSIQRSFSPKVRRVQVPSLYSVVRLPSVFPLETTDSHFPPPLQTNLPFTSPSSRLYDHSVASSGVSEYLILQKYPESFCPISSVQFSPVHIPCYLFDSLSSSLASANVLAAPLSPSLAFE